MKTTPRLCAAAVVLFSAPLHAGSFETGVSRFKAPIEAPTPILALPASGVDASLAASPSFLSGASLLVATGLAQPAAPWAHANALAPTALDALGAMASGAGAKADPGANPSLALGPAFDGSKSLKASEAEAGGSAGSGLSGGDNNGSGGGSGGPGGPGPNDFSSDDDWLGRLHPRVVMILDTLHVPASERLVSRIEALLDNHVHVIFVTARPEKGENSAESLLVSRLKARTGNPIIVASSNGARITALNSRRAEKPRGLVADMPGFAPATISNLQKINHALKVKLSLGSEAKELGLPSLEEAQIYGLELPAETDLQAAASFYNQRLAASGYPYRVEPVVDGEGRKLLFTQATALRLNTTRLFEALKAQFPHLGAEQGLRPEEILVLADPNKAPRFLKSLPGKGYSIHGVTDNASLEEALGAVLGNVALEKVSVLRYQLRAYTEWLEAQVKFGPQGGSRGGFYVGSASRYYRELGFYRGILVYDLMGRLYHLMRKGQFAEASPEAAEALLRKMWYYPFGNGVRISENMEAMRHTPKWRSLQRGYFETALVWLRNYYRRNFKDYPTNVSEQVVGTMINLARDSKNSITVEYAAPYTGRRYLVHLLPARAHIERDDSGNILVAHVYRTGKEPYEEEFDDSVETNLLARAMLQGYALKRADGRWYVNDEPDPRVRVVFHYNTRDLSRIQTAAEVEKQSSDVTSLIEKMLADTEFMAHWKEQEAKNKKAATGKAQARAKAAQRKPKPGANAAGSSQS